MKISEYRRAAYDLMGVGPDYKGPVLVPSQMHEYCHPERDREFLICLGEHYLHLLNRRTPAIADGANPDMPTQQLRLHFGELTNNEIRLVRAAIRFANSQRADGVGVEELRAILEQADMDLSVVKDCIPSKADREKFIAPAHERIKNAISKLRS